MGNMSKIAGVLKNDPRHLSGAYGIWHYINSQIKYSKERYKLYSTTLNLRIVSCEIMLYQSLKMCFSTLLFVEFYFSIILVNKSDFAFFRLCENLAKSIQSRISKQLIYVHDFMLTGALISQLPSDFY